MGKIAALVLPAKRHEEIDKLCLKMGDLLCQSSLHTVEREIYYGSNAVCGLLHIAPDAINPGAQPAAYGERTGVACGYYLRDGEDAGAAGEHNPASVADSAHRLLADVAGAGERALIRGDGVYAFACWDREKERLTAGVDKLGMRPLFWTPVKGGGYAFASEIKALVPFIGEPAVNWSAWEEHLTFGFLFGNHTLLDGISRLGAAECIHCDASNHSSSQVEDFLRQIDVVDRPVDDFLEEQGETFDRAMQRLAGLINRNHEPILTLSGGFDSRRILGWLLHADRTFDTYTVPMICPDGSEYESGIVRELCSRFGINGYSVYPDSLAERRFVTEVRDVSADFESDEHNFATILAMALDGGNKINFDGLGGDVIVNGLFLRKIYYAANGRESFMTDWPDKNLPAWLRLPQTEPPLNVRMRRFLDQWGDDPNRYTWFYLMSRTRREVGLAPFLIQENSMASLCPYLDRGVMASALSFPPARRAEGNLQRELIKHHYPDLLSVATTHDEGIQTDRRYLRMTGGMERAVRVQALRTLTRQLPAAKAGRIRAMQRWRFRAALKLYSWLPADFVKWELGKADKALTLLNFLQLARTGDEYMQEASAISGVFGSRPQWIKSLDDDTRE